MAKILIVEDDEFLLRMYRTRFEADGHKIITTSEGEEALKLIKENGFDIILLDIMLPKISGLTILSEIKKDQKLSQIPVVVLSNLADPNQIEEAKKLGAAEFLLKSEHTPSQVVEIVKKYF